jgi:hypothetical protein
VKNLINYLYNLNSSQLLPIIQGSVGVISLILSFFTFKFARKAQKAIVRNHTLNKQLEAMTELLKHLNDSKIDISFWEFSPTGGSGSSSLLLYNIFEIGKLLNNTELHPLDRQPYDMNTFDDVPIIFNRESNQILDIKDFIDNPFIPKSIADNLKDFYVPNYNLIDGDLLRRNSECVVILETGIFKSNKRIQNEERPNDFYIEGKTFVLLSWLNLKVYSFELTKKIETWFKIHGIKDVNLRIDYKIIH